MRLAGPARNGDLLAHITCRCPGTLWTRLRALPTWQCDTCHQQATILATGILNPTGITTNQPAEQTATTTAA